MPETFDPAPMRGAYAALLDVVPSPGPPPPGEWSAGRILAHVSLVTAATVAAVNAVGSGAISTYDNRLAQDAWTLDRIAGLAGGLDGLRGRIRAQGEALGLLAAALSPAELATPVPALLLSNGACLVDAPLTVADILAGLTDVELPGHAKQLL
jgi:hypothetical protein